MTFFLIITDEQTILSESHRIHSSVKKIKYTGIFSTTEQH